MRTRSGNSRSRTAVPSARNSGLERTSKLILPSLDVRIRSMARAVLTGMVHFSTTIFGDSEASRICRAVFSQYWRSAALPAPAPKVFVGVFTPTKMISDSLMPLSMSVSKKRFFPRVAPMISSSPGSYTGRSSEFQRAIFS